jgi:hypothetical protein
MRSRRMAGTPKIRKPSVRIQKIRKPSGSKRYENLLDPKDGGKLTDHPLTKDAASNAKGRKAGDVMTSMSSCPSMNDGSYLRHPIQQLNNSIIQSTTRSFYRMLSRNHHGEETTATPPPSQHCRELSRASHQPCARGCANSSYWCA